MNNRSSSSDRRSLQEVVLSMETCHLEKGGGYRATDLRRLIGNPVKGLGLAGHTSAKPVTTSDGGLLGGQDCGAAESQQRQDR